MLPDKYRGHVIQFEPEGDTALLLAIGRELEAEDNLEGAAAAYDRAYGIDPRDPEVRHHRSRVLDQLALVEQGIVFRYVPEGAFLMGCDSGDADERPCHPVWLRPFWLSEVPVSWAAFCRLMDWEPPPAGHPRRWATVQDAEGFREEDYSILHANKIRLQYCEDRTTRARDWHSHDPGGRWGTGEQTQTSQELFGAPDRTDAAAPWQYDTKPMIAVSWEQAAALGPRLSTAKIRYELPSEAQWERAARGGLIGARYPWGNEPPTHERCDFDRFREFSILPSRTFPPNGYGLYAMSGGVWEWTRDWYDRERYPSSWQDPEGPTTGEEHTLRGGCWADCADVLRVSFRMSRNDGRTPNIGFRLCRTTEPTARAP